MSADIDDPSRVAFRQIMGVFHQYEKTMLVAKLRGARQRKKVAEGSCEGRKAYGYREGEQKVITRIMELRGEGLPLQAIADAVNSGDKAVKTRAGKQWSAVQVNRILARASTRKGCRGSSSESYHGKMPIQSNVLDRLVAARHLIDTAGQGLTPVSDPLSVAQKILICHDSSELVFWALSSQIGAKPLDAKGNPIRVLKDASFIAIANAVIEKIYVEDDRVGLATALIDDMNRSRVAFKHFGTLPNVESTWHIFADVTSLLDDLCNRSIGRPLLDIDQTAAIQSDDVKEGFRKARTFLEYGQYQEALEAISLTLHDAFMSANLPDLITPGNVSTEDALLLSGRGIDPASFLTMQKIIPTTHNGQAIEWNLRGTGHQENWSAEYAGFCLKTAISCVVKLQCAQVIPSPRGFYTWFDDVIEIAVDNPDVLLDKHSLGLSMCWGRTAVFKKGDRIKGRLKVAWHEGDEGDEGSDANESELEHAPFVILERAVHANLEENRLYSSNRLRFVRDQVLISYESNGWKETMERLSR